MNKINKKELIERICSQLEKDMEALKASAIATYKAATDEESQPENEYDTRALEASYLAGAQAKRVQEIEEQLSIYKYIEVKNFDENTPIGATALIELDSNGKRTILFMMPKGGGLNLSLSGTSIQVVTPASPLGEALVGLKTGDVAIVETGAQTREYEILTVM